MDISNKFMVSMTTSGAILILNKDKLVRMNPDDALNLAAWLVAIAESNATFPFGKILYEVEKT